MGTHNYHALVMLLKCGHAHWACEWHTGSQQMRCAALSCKNDELPGIWTECDARKTEKFTCMTHFSLPASL